MDQDGAAGVPLLDRIGDGWRCRTGQKTGSERAAGHPSLAAVAVGSSFSCYICDYDDRGNHLALLGVEAWALRWPIHIHEEPIQVGLRRPWSWGLVASSSAPVFWGLFPLLQ
jgi:hypothetical protein